MDVTRRISEGIDKLWGRNKPEAAADQRTDNQRMHDGMRDPAARVYGHRATIHPTEMLSVEVTAAGEVVAVWFRCQQLPFKQSFASHQRAGNIRGSAAPRLVAVEVID